MWELLGQAIWFFLPAGIANMAASLSRFISLSNYPVDFGKTWKGKRIFGSHKTWRGIFFGTLFGILTFWGQQCLYQFEFFKSLSLFDYIEASRVIGLLLGLGAVWGDSIRSFFKRRINIKPGGTWMPFDQIDYTIGAFALVSIVFFPGWKVGITAVCLGFIVHIFFNLCAYVLRIQKNKF